MPAVWYVAFLPKEVDLHPV